MKIVFMGTPDYAVKTLEALLSSRHEVAAVFAQPDKPVGRRQVLTPPPVKVCAAAHGIPVYQPRTLRDGEALSLLKKIAPDVIVVVAYGKILPAELLTLPPYGCINAHASLLPKYRGASPIQWAIVCGETVTGVTTMRMDEGMDTGELLETAETAIGAEETADELFSRLSEIGAALTLQTLEKLEAGTLTPVKQSEADASYAPIIKKEMAQLRFDRQTAQEIHNAVRGYYSWPCAYFLFRGKRIKVIKAAVGGATEQLPGTVTAAGDELVIACRGNGTVRLQVLQPEGAKPMTAKQMLCGRPIPVGTVLEE